MKRLATFLVFILIVVFTGRPVNSQTTSSGGYQIRSFDSHILLQKDTDLLITETIVVNFLQPRHGIFRDIPVVYSAKGRTIRAGFDVQSVTDGNGNPYQFEVNRTGRSREVKIGDPDKLITREHTYVITYRISNILQRFDQYDEIYWNVVGSGWDTPIMDATATLESPYAEIIQADCFAGALYSEQKLCRTQGLGGEARFISTAPINRGSDFTIIVGINKNNNLNYPSFLERIVGVIFANWGYLVSAFPFLTIFYLWYKRGRDKRYIEENVYYKPDNVSTKTVALFRRDHLPTVYGPIDGLSPAETGTIVDERVDIEDVIAEILELARLGYIKIVKIKKERILKDKVEYAFVKQGKAEDDKELEKLKDYQAYLLKELFRSTVVNKSVKEVEKLFKKEDKKLDETRRLLAKGDYSTLSGLKKHFYEGLPEFKKKLYKRMESEGFFAEDPDKTRVKWIGIFIGVDVVAIVVIFMFFELTGNWGPLLIAGILSIPGFILAFFMPRRTPKGYSLFRQIEGLKFYVDKGKWRLEVQEKHLFIEEILPLAVSLGVADKLAEDMQDLAIKPPDYVYGFSSNNFSSDFSDFKSSTSGSFVPKSSGSSWSGGSGFSGGSSGGGFGGGGGGSW